MSTSMSFQVLTEESKIVAIEYDEKFEDEYYNGCSAMNSPCLKITINDGMGEISALVTKDDLKKVLDSIEALLK